MKIGVIDSGLGGYFFFEELVKELPNHQYYFVGDNKFCPYGIKSRKIIFERTSKMIKYLLNKKVDLIIIACNTIATTILEDLKKEYKVSFYSISFYNIKQVKKDINKNAIIATDNTISSCFFQKELGEGFYIKASELVILIEKSEINEIKNYLLAIKNQYNLDNYNILLGCTHFLGIIEIFKETFKSSNIINGNQLLIEDLKRLKCSKPSKKIFTTGSKSKFKKSIFKILKIKKIKIKKIKL